MLARLTALVVAGALAAGCQEEDAAPVPGSCTDDPQAIVTALGAAPETVDLGNGTRISECISLSDNVADLQNVGVTFSSAAEDLEALALEGDADAAVALGYLAGAVERGSRRNIGISAEIVRRIERSAAIEVSPEVDAAIQRGFDAGTEQG